MEIKKNIQQQILARSLYVLSALLVNVAIARFTDAAATGSLFFATAIFSLIVLIGGMSLESALGYFYAGKKIGAQQVILMACFHITALLLLLLLIQFLFPHFFTTLSNGFISGIYWFVFGTMLTNYFLSTLYSRKQYVKPNVIQTALNMLLIFTLWIEQSNHYPVSILFQTYFYFVLVNGIGIFSIFIWNVKNEKVFIANKVKFTKVYQYAFQALWANVLFFLVYRLDYWFVHQYTTITEAGNYIQASKLAQMFILLPQFIAPVIFNSIATNAGTQQLHLWLIALMKLFLLLFVFLFCLLAIGGHYVFTLLLGNSFNDMNNVLLLLMPGLFFLSCLNLLSAYFGGTNRIRINMIGAALAAVITLVGNICIIPFYSIYWAALISTLAYTIAAVWALYSYKKINPSVSMALYSFNPSDWYAIRSIFNLKHE